jgi:polyisoprenoid-binding protein YceI
VLIRGCLGALVALIAAPVAAQETYAIDPAHSKPVFETRHMGYSLQRGTLGKVTGKVTLDRAAKKGAVDLTLDLSGVNTGDPRLDAAIKGEKFFNVEKFPTATFRSATLAFDGDRLTAVEGELTMLGVTKPVTLKVVDFVCGENPFNKKPMCGGDAQATIRRSDWGMTANLPLAPADEVRLLIPFEGYKELP